MTTFNESVAPDEAIKLEGMRIYYQLLRQQLNERAALADALSTQLEPNTHSFHLGQLLTTMCSDVTHLYALDRLFGVDHNGKEV
jgi:hypothetical protein